MQCGLCWFVTECQSSPAPGFSYTGGNAEGAEKYISQSVAYYRVKIPLAYHETRWSTNQGHLKLHLSLNSHWKGMQKNGLLYLSVTTHAVIGQLGVPYSTVRPANG